MKLYYTTDFSGSSEDSRANLFLSLERYLSDTSRDEDVGELISRIEKGPMGKPSIPGFDAFSISHSDQCWAVLFSEQECGLDVQYTRGVQYKKIASRFFNRDEALSVRKKGIEEFYRIWARREAYRKALGQSVFSEGESVLFDEIKHKGVSWKLQDVRMPFDIFAAACVQSDEEIEIERLYEQ